MTTINRQVDANADDAYEAQDGTGFNNGDNCRAHSNAVIGSRYISGHRLTNVAVPKGADIIAATIQIWASGGALDDANIDIHAEDVDDAANFIDTADVMSRDRTAASVAWVENGLNGGRFQTSPDISAVIQEVVDRGSWASGNALVILLKGKSDISKSLVTSSHLNADIEALKLDITYAITRKRSYARGIL